MENLPFYNSKKIFILIQLLTYVLASLLIVNDIYPFGISIVTGLLIPGLYLYYFVGELFSLLIGSVLLTIATAVFSRKKQYLITFFVFHYLVTLISAYFYMGSFN